MVKKLPRVRRIENSGDGMGREALTAAAPGMRSREVEARVLSSEVPCGALSTSAIFGA